jgi:hypothetical protein
MTFLDLMVCIAATGLDSGGQKILVEPEVGLHVRPMSR